VTGAVELTIPGWTVIPAGREVYLSPDKVAFRARETSPKGGEARLVVGPYEGHLSSLGETVVLLDNNGVEVSRLAYPGDPSDVQLYLRVSEVMYHPASHEDAEFIELVNTSDSVTLDLEGVSFVAGVTFSFTGSAVTTLAPGARVLVVLSRAVFEAVYGQGLSHLIAGEFAGDTKLSNGGEEIDLEDASGSTVVKFTYDDTAAWGGAGADGQGHSLVLGDPGADPDMAANWTPSATLGGSPGAAESGVTFPGDPDADSDSDGVPDLVEWVLSGTLTDAVLPTVSVERLDVGGLEDDYLVFSGRRFAAAAGVTLDVQSAASLANWQSGDAVFLDATPLGDGTTLVRYRSAQPVSSTPTRFMRWLIGVQ
jgi:hypothetical protein